MGESSLCGSGLSGDRCRLSSLLEAVCRTAAQDQLSAVIRTIKYVIGGYCIDRRKQRHGIFHTAGRIVCALYSKGLESSLVPWAR